MHFIAAASVEHWYTNGTVIGVTGVIVGVAAIVVAVVLWRFGTPRGSLEYSMPVAKALVSRSPSLRDDDLQISLRGKVVQNPHLVTLRIVNRGHRDIRSEDFDQGNPILVDLGAKIVDVLNVYNIDESKIGLEGKNKLALMPMLVRRGDQLTIDVMTEGSPTLSLSDSLADTKVRFQLQWSNFPRRVVVITMWGSTISAFGMVAYAVGIGIHNSILNVIGALLFIVGFAAVGIAQAPHLDYLNKHLPMSKK
jgi:hypothetical protein